MIKEIDYALVEETRPPLYTAMKYWGKKPHNIWGEYIDCYTPEGGITLDPFAGSAMSAFEAIKKGRKAIAFDLNPLTSFVIEVYATKFKASEFQDAVDAIYNSVLTDITYKNLFSTNCVECGSNDAAYQHFKWENGEIYEAGIECPKCGLRSLDPGHHKKPDLVPIPFWIPSDKFHESPSFSESFVKSVGSENYRDLWTNRNLYVLSFIFDEILKVPDNDLKCQLLFGFIQTLHLCSRMCVPRRSAANRAFSTSWGRSAYLCANRQMEMNPLILFKRSCLGRQSVKSALISVKDYLGKIPTIRYVTKNRIASKDCDADIQYGIVDIKELSDYIEPGSIDFIITDPPYGGLVQYLDLSSVWLIWLQKADSRFKPDYEKEITIKDGIIDVNTYTHRFTEGISELYKALKDNGKIVFTFHNNDITVWNAFLRSLSRAC